MRGKPFLHFHLLIAFVVSCTLLRKCQGQLEVTRTTPLGDITGVRTLVPGTPDTHVDRSIP